MQKLQKQKRAGRLETEFHMDMWNENDSWEQEQESYIVHDVAIMEATISTYLTSR